MRVAEGDAAWVCVRSGKPRLTNGVVCDLDVLEVTCRPVVRPASAERESRQVWTCMRTDGRAKISIALEVPQFHSSITDFDPPSCSSRATAPTIVVEAVQPMMLEMPRHGQNRQNMLVHGNLLRRNAVRKYTATALRSQSWPTSEHSFCIGQPSTAVNSVCPRQ